ncbi:MAG: murein transglycosylase A [Acidiferrobacteraceae bacterium]
MPGRDLGRRGAVGDPGRQRGFWNRCGCLWRGHVPAATLVLLLVLSSCAAPPPVPGIGPPIPWSDVKGWASDHQSHAWPALLAECRVPPSLPPWAALCRAARSEPHPNSAEARTFLETWFVPHRVYADDGHRVGLMTGYYEPLVAGSLTRTSRFRYPLYRPPANLLHIDLSGIDPALRGQHLRGRLVGRRVVPYYSRGDIDRSHLLRGDEIAWLASPIAAFVMQVQGSGVVRLPDGRLVALRFADDNGYAYRPMLDCFRREHLAPPKRLDLPGLKAWLRAHPRRAQRVLDCNPSYVFFRRGHASRAPLGALGVRLTPRRSIAVDPRYIPLGTPVWLHVRGMNPPIRRLVFAQDVGGAIRGPVRADFFWGRGRAAGRLAGRMKNPGTLIVLLPRPAPKGSS